MCDCTLFNQYHWFFRPFFLPDLPVASGVFGVFGVGMGALISVRQSWRVNRTYKPTIARCMPPCQPLEKYSKFEKLLGYEPL
jgi:hypothetical protein